MDAAPTGYVTRFQVTVLDFMPTAQALFNSSRFFHEAIGLGWYHLRIAPRPAVFSPQRRRDAKKDTAE